jgi:hypothetical protein
MPAEIPEIAAMRAWELWTDGYSQYQIYAEMKDSHGCGSPTTARRWRDRGRELYMLSDGDTMGRKAQRYRQSARLHNRLVRIHAAMETGQIPKDRGYALANQTDALIAKLHGTDAAPPARKVKVSGGKGAQVDPRTLDVLAAAYQDLYGDEEGTA